MNDILILVLVGVIWGATNYGMEHTYKPSKQDTIIKFIMNNPKPLLFIGLNYSGSLLFYLMLSKNG